MPNSYPLDDETKVSTPENRLRRQLLKGSVGTVVVAALAYLGWTKYLFPTEGPSAAPGKGDPAAGVTLGAVSSFLPGAPPKLVSVKLPQSDHVASYYVENLSGGNFRVLSASCTHRGCTVDWNRQANQFLCPCHGAQYDITGKVLSPPAPQPLPVVSTRIVGDTLYGSV